MSRFNPTENVLIDVTKPLILVTTIVDEARIGAPRKKGKPNFKCLGFFWCEWDYCIPTSIAKNTMFFLFYQVPFEGSYPYDTPSD